MSYSDRMAQILADDHSRFVAREADSDRVAREILSAHTPRTHERDDSWINPELIRGAGVITPPRQYPNHEPRVHASEAFCDSSGAVVYVPGAVKITHADGSVTFETSRRRGTSRRRSTRRTVASTPETSRVTLDSRDVQALADGTA